MGGGVEYKIYIFGLGNWVDDDNIQRLGILK